MRKYGLGFRPQIFEEMLSNKETIDWCEIISENYMNVGGRPKRLLREIASSFPIACHGVGINIGGISPLDPEYLYHLRNLIDEIQPQFVSDHLCWTAYDKKNSHDLLPLIYSDETLCLLTRKINELQDILKRRFYLENPSAYISFRSHEMSEEIFLSELSKQTGCGILLDINNLYVNAKNLAYDPIKYLQALNSECVGYFHIAGHSQNENIRIDTHDQPVCPDVWELYSIASAFFPQAWTILERDDHFPPFNEILQEIHTARNLQQQATYDYIQIEKTSGNNKKVEKNRADLSKIPVAWRVAQKQMISLVEQPNQILKTDERLDLFDPMTPTSVHSGITVYNNAYFFRIRDCLRSDFQTLERILGKSSFSTMVLNYLADCPSSNYDLQLAGEKLPGWLLSSKVPWSDGWQNSALADIAHLELKRIFSYRAPDGHERAKFSDLEKLSETELEQTSFIFAPHVHTLSTNHDITDTWLKAQHEADHLLPPPTQSCDYIVYRYLENIYHTQLENNSARLLKSLRNKATFSEASRVFCNQDIIDEADMIAIIGNLNQWFELDLIEKIL